MFDTNSSTGTYIQNLKNLNHARLGCAPNELTIKSYALSKNGVHIYIGNLIEPLCEWILKADVVVGCVAWMTHSVVLEALANTSCQIIVQKEDWLRPDSDNSFERLREQYSALNSNMINFEYNLSTGSYFNIEAVRCVGMHNHSRSPAFPRMHHKFLVFCRSEPAEEEWGFPRRCPFAVWTGSFNITNNGTNSRENAVVIEDEDIATTYYNEWMQMLFLSESLDWQHIWVAPQFRYNQT